MATKKRFRQYWRWHLKQAERSISISMRMDPVMSATAKVVDMAEAFRFISQKITELYAGEGHKGR